MPIPSTMGSTVVDFSCARVVQGIHPCGDHFIFRLPLIDIEFWAHIASAITRTS
jgi:hypothetical protein